MLTSHQKTATVAAAHVKACMHELVTATSTARHVVSKTGVNMKAKMADEELSQYITGSQKRVGVNTSIWCAASG